MRNIIQKICSNAFDVFHDSCIIVRLLEIGSLVVTLFIVVHRIWRLYHLHDNKLVYEKGMSHLYLR